MMKKTTTYRPFLTTALTARRWIVVATVFILALSSCERRPILHLPNDNAEIDLPVVDIDFDVYWSYDVDYSWKNEWFYGWDEYDRELFGELEYAKPERFNIRRYYTGRQANAPHMSVYGDVVNGYYYHAHFNWGFWDILTWNDIETIDGIQSLVFDEQTTLDSVFAYTNETMHPSRYNAPRFTRAFFQPEALYCDYEQAIDIDESLEGFVYDEERGAYVKNIDMMLYPVTYIYLTQVILHNNRGRVASVDGNANLSGMARTVNLNTGVAGKDPVTVHYNVRFKEDCDMKGESVDIVGGRLMSFGMCNVNGSRADAKTRNNGSNTHWSNGPYFVESNDGSLPYINDGNKHYIDVVMQFNNGIDSTFVFDVTRQVQQKYKGGVITMELNMDTVPIPSRSGGSGFDAVVKDYEDGGTHEFPI